MGIKISNYILGILFVTGMLPLFAEKAIEGITNEQPVFASQTQQLIIVGGDHAYPPYEFLENGKPTGFNVELLQAVAETMGMDVEIILMPWSIAKTNLTTGAIQLISGMYLDQERSNHFIFSTPHSMVTPGIFVKEGSPISSFEDLHKLKVAVQRGDVCHEFLLNSDMDCEVLEVSDPLDALIMLSKDICDAVLLSSKLQGRFYIETYSIKNIKSLNLNLPVRQYCFASVPGNEDLIFKLNEGLNILHTTGDYNVIYNKWFGIYDRPTYHKPVLWIVSIITGLLLLSVVWTWSLRQRVKRQVDTIRESEKLFTTIFRESPSIILISDYASGKLLKVNSAFEQSSGYSDFEVVGKPIFDTGLMDNPEDCAIMKSLLKSESYISSREFVFRRKDGERLTCLVSASSIQYQENPAVILVVTDISERKKLEAEFERAKLKAEESDRLKSAFLSNMSHQIRTPMNAIVGFVELLLDENLSTEDKSEFVYHVKNNSYQLLDIITDIINISKIDSGTETLHITDINLEKMVQKVEQQFKILADDRHLQFKRINNIQRADYHLQSDSVKLTQVLSNLLHNAIKNTTEGNIEFGYEIDDKQIMFKVKDTGIGIPENKHSEIFRRFVTFGDLTNDEHTGTGLGLTIAKAYTELLGGSISVTSAIGKGTTFTVTLPISDSI